MVIPDADVWIDFLNQRSGSDDLASLVEDDEAILVGPVIAEILRGERDPAQRERTLEHLQGIHYIEITRDVWTRAGDIAANLDTRGLRIPMPDVFIAALAIENGHEVLTRDKHFERIPGLRLYGPTGSTP